MTPEWVPAAILAISAWLVTWGAWVTLRISAHSGSTMTRDEHAKVCEANEARRDARFAELKSDLQRAMHDLASLLERQSTNSDRQRSELAGSMTTLVAKIAALEVSTAAATTAAAQAAHAASQAAAAQLTYAHRREKDRD